MKHKNDKPQQNIYRLELGTGVRCMSGEVYVCVCLCEGKREPE